MKREFGMSFDWGKSVGRGSSGGRVCLGIDEVELSELRKRVKEFRVRFLEDMNEWYV